MTRAASTGAASVGPFLFFWYFSGVVHVILLVNGATTSFGLRRGDHRQPALLIPLILVPQRAAGSLPASASCSGSSRFSARLFRDLRTGILAGVIFIMFRIEPGRSERVFRAVLRLVDGAGLLIWQDCLAAVASRASGLPVAAQRLGCRRADSGDALRLPQIKNIRRGLLSPAVAAENDPEAHGACRALADDGRLQYQGAAFRHAGVARPNKQLPPIGNLVDANSGPATGRPRHRQSTNRQHMSLYGYPRQTTPRLDALRNELTVFNNVIGPRPYRSRSCSRC